MADAEIISGTVDELIVGSGESYRLRGTVLGNCEVLQGGFLVHEGLIRGRLLVRAGGRADIRGVSEAMEWEDAYDVEFHGFGKASPGCMKVPFVGPDGWGALDAAWESCVVSIDDAVQLASLQPYMNERRRDTTDEAFLAATAAMVLAGPTDVQLWGLLSAAVFHPKEEMRVRQREVWSPQDCRDQLSWRRAGRYLDASPELFVELLPHANRAGRSLAFDYYEAVSALMRAVLAIGAPPPPEAVGRFEAFRTMLREQAAGTSTMTGSKKPSARKPRSKGPPTEPGPRRKAPAKKRPAASRGMASGSGERPASGSPVKAETDPVDAALAELDSLIGLSTVKEEVRKIGAFAAIEKRRLLAGLPETEITRHLVMTGNPGTGKTTVARLLGEIYAGYGLLKKPTVVEIPSGRHLLGQYIGHTEENVKKIFKRALGGVLFIDEAYSLASPSDGGRDFGRQGIDTLVPLLENHREEIMVVVAGYPKPMDEFLGANPGLEGRFGRKIHFPDYADDELLEILRRFCEQGGYNLDEGAAQACPDIIRAARERMGERFPNARMVRTLFEMAVQRHHDRLAEMERSEQRDVTDTELRELLAEDIPTAEDVAPGAGDGA